MHTQPTISPKTKCRAGLLATAVLALSAPTLALANNAVTDELPTTAVFEPYAQSLTGDNIPLRTYFPWIHDPAFAEQMPVFDTLMDPFTFFAPVGYTSALGTNGRVETPADWELRRAEILDLMMYYYWGYMWPTTHEQVTVNTTTRPANGESITITVNETRLDGTPTTATGEIASDVWLPSPQQLADNGFSETGGPLLILATSLSGGPHPLITPERRDEILARGIGLATVANAPGNENRTGMYFDLFPFDPTITQYNTGTLMAFAWTTSRIIDAFELNPDWGVNPNAIATLGNSFAGKRALFAGIMDERVALTIPHESGGDGGMAPFRMSQAGRINHFGHDNFGRVHSRHETTRTGAAGRGASNVANFFRANAPYGESINLLPFDTHLAAAMIAGSGRVLLSLETDNFGSWTGFGPARNVAYAAQEVFAFLGYQDNLIFRQKGSFHAIHESDLTVILGVLDYLFGQPVHADGYRGGREASQVYLEDMWNVALPGVWDSLSYLQRTPLSVDSAWMQWSRPGVHTLWTHTEYIAHGHPATIVAHTDASEVELIAWSHGDGNALWGADNPPIELARWTAPVVDGIAVFELSASETYIGRYELRAVGELDPRSVFFHALDTHTILRSGATQDNVGSHMMFGFTSRINPDLRLYATGADGVTQARELSPYQNVGGNWRMPYGVRVGNIGGEGDERHFTLRNVVFEALPSFTFEINFQENLNGGGWGSGRPDTPATWAASPAVQHIGPYPHWRSSGTGQRPDATPVPYATRPATEFEATLTHALSRNSAGQVVSWTIDFSEPMSPREIGIGFDFGGAFSLTWNSDATQLTATFEEPTDTNEVNTLNMYIMRLRDARFSEEDILTQLLTRTIGAPIRYAFEF